MKKLFAFGILLASSAIFAAPSYAAPFKCKATGGDRTNYRIKPGKIGPYKATVSGNKVLFTVRGRKGEVRSNGRVYVDGTAYGKVLCDMSKVRAEVSR